MKAETMDLGLCVCFSCAQLDCDHQISRFRRALNQLWLQKFQLFLHSLDLNFRISQFLQAINITVSSTTNFTDKRTISGTADITI